MGSKNVLCFWVLKIKSLFLLKVQVSFSFSWNGWLCDCGWQSCGATVQTHFSTSLSSMAFLCWFTVEGLYLLIIYSMPLFVLVGCIYFDVITWWGWCQVIPFRMFELQSKWIAGVLSNRLILPSQQEMMEDVEAFYSSLEVSGTPKRYTHKLSDYQVYIFPNQEPNMVYFDVCYLVFLGSHDQVWWLMAHFQCAVKVNKFYNDWKQIKSFCAL